MRRFAPLFGLTLVAATACGVPGQLPATLGGHPGGKAAPGGSGATAQRSPRLQPFTGLTRLHRSMVKTDDHDMAGTLRISGDLRMRLRSEAIEKGERLTFATRTTGGGSLAVPHGGDSVPVVGQLLGQNLAGDQVGIPNATVELRGKGNQVVGSGITAADGTWRIDLDAKYQRIALVVRYVLANKQWKIGDYDWKGPEFTAGGGVDVGQSLIDPGTANGQAVLIHEVFNRYISFFAAQGVSLAFWDAAIGVEWPASGDYYSWGTVHLTDARQWDVNGHEIGHAVSDIGLNMRFGGGQHYIDQCYNETLAWSEGVASFLGLAVSKSPDDPDARFEFMVKRRAPLRYENVPGAKDPDHPDAPPVCEGPTNEWRAGAAMWDMYDTHQDGTDSSAVPFGTIWNAMAKGNGKPPISSVKHAFKYVGEKVDEATRAGFPATARQNTIAL